MVYPETIESRIALFKNACKRCGLRLTPQRLEIYRVVAESEEHPDVDQVHQMVREKLPTISLDTVYRTLTTFEELGLIHRVQALAKCRRYDANLDAHHHFICTGCGMIRDFSSDDFDRLAIPAAVQEMGVVQSRHTELRGICTACQARGGRNRKPS